MSEEFIDPPPITPPPEPEPPGAPDTNVHFLHYKPATGEIVGVGHCPASALEVNSDLYPALGFLSGTSASAEFQMVDVVAEPPVVVSRPAFPITISKTSVLPDGVDGAVISGVPAGTVVTLLATADFGEYAETVSGSMTLTTVHALPHVLRFENFPYRTREVTIIGDEDADGIAISGAEPSGPVANVAGATGAHPFAGVTISHPGAAGDELAILIDATPYKWDMDFTPASRGALDDPAGVVFAANDGGYFEARGTAAALTTALRRLDLNCYDGFWHADDAENGTSLPLGANQSYALTLILRAAYVVDEAIDYGTMVEDMNSVVTLTQG